MALMVEECAGMPSKTITTYVQHSFALASTSTGAAAAVSSSPVQNSRDEANMRTSASAAATSPSTSPLCPSQPPPGRAPEERAHAWVVVARLLCESGDWARAIAVVDGLPSPLQQPVRLKMLRDDWPLPRNVADLWRRTQGKVAADLRTQCTSPALAASTLMTPFKEKPAAVRASNAEPSLSFPAVQTKPAKEALVPSPGAPPQPRHAAHRTEELVRLAYNLRRPIAARGIASPTAALTSADSQKTTASAMPLRVEQQALVEELTRRGAIEEVLQCLVNWQRRRLVAPDIEDAIRAHNAGGDGAAASAERTDDVVEANTILKSVLFPTYALSCSRGDVAFVPVSSSSAAGGEPHVYSDAQRRHIRVALTAHPLLVARCVRDRLVVDRLLRHAGEKEVAEMCVCLLRVLSQSVRPNLPTGAPAASVTTSTASHASAVTIKGRGSSFTPPHSPLPSQQQLSMVALETHWRALAALMPTLHPYWQRQPKVEKEVLLHTLCDALEATKRSWDVRRTSMHSSLSPTSTDKAVAAAREAKPDVSRTKCRHAMMASVESVCSPLLHHEPQVRFLRLAVFGRLALLLTSLGVAVPNALVQCLFFCMGDHGHVALPASEETTTTGSRSSAEVEDNSVRQYLEAPPTDRWRPALALVHQAHAQSIFRVTSAHARAVLNGLQSISIPKTWPQALQCADVFEHDFHVTPDERTLPSLLLNLKQQSWQDAFRVLRWVPGGLESGAVPIPILRDLQLVALKHASWEVPLQLMAQLQARQADGFINYLYCLCAAARGGQAEAAFQHFLSLERGRGRHTSMLSVSPFNELTVAVAAVAMLDRQHDDALVEFCERVLAMPARKMSGAGEAGDNASDKTTETHHLTQDGHLMAQAAMASALLTLSKYSALVAFLTALSVGTVKLVLRRLVALRCLAGMAHLNAPVRLVFDVLRHGADTSRGVDGVHDIFLRSVEALPVRNGTFETRQHSSRTQRRQLFIPATHQRLQKIALATQLGVFVKHTESSLSAAMVQMLAETMVEEGVGAEYMAAALF